MVQNNLHGKRNLDVTKQTNDQSMRNESGMRIMYGLIFLLSERFKIKENKNLLLG